MRRQNRNRFSGECLSLARCREILAVSPQAGPREIKKAYRHLAFVWHPDRFPNSDIHLRKRAEERFKQLNSAYQTLMAASAGGRSSSAFPPAQSSQSQEQEIKAARRGGGRRSVTWMVCLMLLSILSAGIAVVGYRYLRIERVHTEARARIEVSERKKEVLLPQPLHRPPPPDLPTPGEAFPTSKRSRAASGLSEPRTPAATPGGTENRSDIPTKPTAGDTERLTIAAMIVAAESLTDEGRYGEARDRYRAALSRIASVRHRDASLRDLEQQIEQALGSDEIRLGAKGYHLYQGRWFSPEQYRTEFIDYRDGRVHYTFLRPAAEEFADPLVRAHLRAVYSNRMIHKNQVACTALHLLDNRSPAPRFQALYRWEVWTFEGVDSGELALDLVYHPQQDRWEAVGLRKRSPQPKSDNFREMDARTLK